MLFAFTFSVDKVVFEVHYNKNVELFYQDLVNIALEYSQYVSQFKRYYLVIGIAITGLEGRFLFIAFPNPHLMIGIGLI